MKKILMGNIAFMVIFGLLIAINIMQNGSRNWDGRSMDEILGVPAEKATVEDLERLSKADVMQLFFAAEEPEFTIMKGEYKAKMLNKGVLGAAGEYYSHHLMGPGHWEGKAFFPFEKDKGSGYNLFTVKKDGVPTIVRCMKMDTSTGGSVFDEKDSFHLVYKAHNKGRNKSMRDELRKINDTLFLGWGYLSWNLGSNNPGPFVLYGEPSPWIGLDKK